MGSSRTTASSCCSTPTTSVRASSRSPKAESTQGHQRAAGIALYNNTLSLKASSSLSAVTVDPDNSRPHYCSGPAEPPQTDVHVSAGCPDEGSVHQVSPPFRH